MEYRRIIPNSISGTNLILGVLSILNLLPAILNGRQYTLFWLLPLMPATGVRQGRSALPASSASRWILFATFVRSALRLP